MVFSNAGGAYDIYVQPKKGETEEEVLQAIVQASFELALADPEECGREPKTVDEAQNLLSGRVKMSDQPEAVVIDMTLVGRRWCMTHVVRVGPNHFRLSNAYQQYRGVPDLMLERVQAILKKS